jgi:hypothetical protein
MTVPGDRVRDAEDNEDVPLKLEEAVDQFLMVSPETGADPFFFLLIGWTEQDRIWPALGHACVRRAHRPPLRNCTDEPRQKPSIRGVHRTLQFGPSRVPTGCVEFTAPQTTAASRRTAKHRPDYRWSIVRRSLARRNRDQAAQEDGMDSNYRAITGCEDAQSHLTWNLRKIRLANIHLFRPRLRGRRPPSVLIAEHNCSSRNPSPPTGFLLTP